MTLFSDEREHAFDLIVDRQAARVERDGVGGLAQRGKVAPCVPGIPGGDVLGYGIERDVLAALGKFSVAALGPVGRIRHHKHLHIGVGKNNSSDVTPFHHHAPAFGDALASEAALYVYESGANTRESAHATRDLTRFRLADALGHFIPVEENAELALAVTHQVEAETGQDALGSVGGQRSVGVEEREARGAVHRARIDIEPPKGVGYTPRRGALTGTGRAVDRYDHAWGLRE